MVFLLLLWLSPCMFLPSPFLGKETFWNRSLSFCWASDHSILPLLQALLAELPPFLCSVWGDSLHLPLCLSRPHSNKDNSPLDTVLSVKRVSISGPLYCGSLLLAQFYRSVKRNLLFLGYKDIQSRI